MWSRVNKYLPYLRFVPFIRMVAVCNNLAFGNVDENSDIDLFIIAKKGRLFTVRILITAFLHILGVRRHGDKVSRRFCLSFFVDDSFLDFKSIAIENDIYLAYWCKTLVPIVDDGVFKDFWDINRKWADKLANLDGVKGFLSGDMSTNKNVNKNKNANEPEKNLEIPDLNKEKVFISYEPICVFCFFFPVFFDKLLMWWQLGRAREKMLKAGNKSSIIVEHNILKFHNIDRRVKYRNEFYDIFFS